MSTPSLTHRFQIPTEAENKLNQHINRVSSLYRRTHPSSWRRAPAGPRGRAGLAAWAGAGEPRPAALIHREGARRPNRLAPRPSEPQAPRPARPPRPAGAERGRFEADLCATEHIHKQRPFKRPECSLGSAVLLQARRRTTSLRLLSRISRSRRI